MTTRILAVAAALITGALTLVDVRIAIGAIAIGFGLYLTVSYPKKVFILFLLGYPLLSNLPRLSLGVLPAISFERLMVGLLTAEMLLKKGFSAHIKVHWSVTILIITLFMSLLYASIRSQHLVYSIQMMIDSYILPCMIFYIGLSLFYRDISAENLSWIFFSMGAYVSIIGIFEFFSHMDLFPQEIGLRETDLFVRSNGPFATSETFGLFLGLCLFIGAYLKKVGQKQWSGKEFAAVMVMLGGMICSMNRGIMISAIIAFSLPYLFRFRNRSKFLFGGFFLVLCIAIIFPYIEEIKFYRERIVIFDSIASRFSANWSAFAMIQDHPIQGIGLNNFYDFSLKSEYNLFFEDYTRPKTIHNAFIDVMTEMGLLGLLPFCGLLTVGGGYLLKCSRYGPDGSIYSISVMIMFVMPFFNDNLTKEAPSNYLFAVFCAAVLSSLIKKKEMAEQNDRNL